jgi:hypothetical protein
MFLGTDLGKKAKESPRDRMTRSKVDFIIVRNGRLVTGRKPKTMFK